MKPARRHPSAASLAGTGLALAAWAWAALLHRGLGPDRGAWERLFVQPTGFLLEWLAASSLAPVGEDVRLGLLVLTAPAAALALAVAFVTRRALPRLVATAAVPTCALFAFYGIQSPVVWRFFGWRWSVSMLAFAWLVTATLLAPMLAARWLRLGWPARLALYAPIVAAVVLIERNVTGTDPSLPFAISPWPAVQVFGLEVGASTGVALLFGVAAGLALLDRAGHQGAALRGGLAVLGAGLAGLFAAAPPLLASSQELLPFQPGPRLLGATAAAAALCYVVAAWSAGARRRRRAQVWALGALLAGLPLLIGLGLSRLDYETTRSARAGRVIEALEAWYTREDTYPERLVQLVEAGDLESVPRPRIGFGFGEAAEFGYQSFGTSYLLEFAAPRWIQCAYSPPYADEWDEEGEAVEDELSGAWSCPSRPPELW